MTIVQTGLSNLFVMSRFFSLYDWRTDLFSI